MKPLFFHPCFLFCDMRIIQIITFFRGIALSLFIPLFIFSVQAQKKDSQISNNPVCYIRIKAMNILVCTDWHPGAGGPS